MSLDIRWTEKYARCPHHTECSTINTFEICHGGNDEADASVLVPILLKGHSYSHLVSTFNFGSRTIPGHELDGTAEES